ncbi:uncharacterized protein [Periplaneta americana]
MNTWKSCQAELKKHIPAPLANEITEELFLRMAATYRRLITKEKDFPWFCSLFRMAVRSALHPSTTEIHYRKSREHPVITDILYKCLPFFGDIILNIKNLTVLTLRSVNYIFTLDNNIDATRNLEEVRCHLSPEALRVLSLQSTRLKKLDIVHCADEHVKYLITFPQLESLRIMRSSLSDGGWSQLLSGFSKVRNSNLDQNPNPTSHRIKELAVDRVSSSVMKSIVCVFPNLTHFSISNPKIHYSLYPVSKLKRLKMLSVTGFAFSGVGDLLAMSGNNLTYLEIYDIDMNDLFIISLTCKSLKCLHLQMMYSSETGFTSGLTYDDYARFKIPEFESVECLRTFWMCNDNLHEYIVSRFVNLRHLYMIEDVGFQITKVFKYGKKDGLEYLFLECGRTSAYEVTFENGYANITKVAYDKGKLLHYRAEI